MSMMRKFTLALATAAASLTLMGGCPDADEIEDILDELDDLEIEIDQSVNTIQTVAPRNSDLPDILIEEGDTIIIDNSATFITDPSEQLIIEELPDITLVGFENLTGLDAYYQYFVDGEFQGIFVFDGETLLIEYPCLFDIEVVSEEYFDPFTGELVDSFELDGAFFTNPEDFECGDAFILSFSADDIVVDVTPIDLLN